MIARAHQLMMEVNDLNKHRVTHQLITKTLLQSSQRPTIATDAETRLPSWMSMRISDRTTFNSILLQEKETKSKRKEFRIISFDFYVFWHLINLFFVLIILILIQILNRFIKI